jgi:GNAT superfamily N-acetyltransferase
MEQDDAQAVSLLITQLGYSRTPEQVREWIASACASSQQTAFVACRNNEVAGWIEISIERRLQSSPFALIGGLVVKDGFRGQGIGRELCRRAEAWSWERLVETVRVTSRSTRPDAHRFYVRDGYRVVKTSMVFEKDRPKPA